MALDLSPGFFDRSIAEFKKRAGEIGEHGMGILGMLGHHQVQTYSYVLAFVGIGTFLVVSSGFH